MRIAPLILLVLLCSGCAKPAYVPDPADRGRYTPHAAWPERREHWDPAALHEQWIGDQLRAMQEPILLPPAPFGGFRSRYRLLVLPSFSPSTAIRIDELPGGRYLETTTQLDGRGGYDPGRIARTWTRLVSAAEIAMLRQALEAARIDSVSAEPAFSWGHPFGRPMCLDGTQFLIETRTPNSYAFVTRHQCQTNSTYREALLLMARIGGVSIEAGQLRH